MSKQRAKQRAKKRKAFKVILGTKEIERRAKDLCIDARQRGFYPCMVQMHKKTNEMHIVAFPKAQCTGIKLNGKKQISAYFRDSKDGVTFIGTLAERENGTLVSQTMETNKMGKYTMSPQSVTDCIGRFVYEYEHWLTGLLEYADKEGIRIEWRPLDLAFRHFQSVPNNKKDGISAQSPNTCFNDEVGRELNAIYHANADGAFHKSLIKEKGAF